MLTSSFKKLIFISLLIFTWSGSFAQLPFNLIDGREHRYCASCAKIIQDIPPEVLFGIQIHTNGDVYFSMSNKEWFDKIFKNNSYGIAIDIVTKDKYDC